ncbi:uncharacterized protein LOC135827787 [Sycon ciliatum]|uniref:uncharacterized protein LOC135827787 n=1 Tax=Sycon ciliatum TaxID=27933 RepID=UPI0031F6016A
MSSGPGTPWDDPEVNEILKEVALHVDDGLLRRKCRKFITTEQDKSLRSMANPVHRNEHLLSMLEAGGARSFQALLEVLGSHEMPVGQERFYKKLQEHSMKFIDVENYDQEVHRLVYIGSSAPSSGHTGAEVDSNTLHLLEIRYLFVLTGSGLIEATPTQNSGGSAMKDSTSRAPSPDQASSSSSSSSTSGRASVVGQSRSGAPESAARRRHKYKSIQEQEELYVKQRLNCRIVLLTGNMDALLNDLSRQGIATPTNMAQLTSIRQSGIYCLTPCSKEKQKPIYMVVCLLSVDNCQCHQQLLRLALQMSRHIVIYFGQESLLSGHAFKPNATLSNGQAEHERDDEFTVRCKSRKKLFLAEEVNTIQLLASVLTEFPINNSIEICHHPVRLHCVLNIAMVVFKSGVLERCHDFCKEQFKGNLFSKLLSTHGQASWHVESPPLVHLIGIWQSEVFDLGRAHHFTVDTTDETASSLTMSGGGSNSNSGRKGTSDPGSALPASAQAPPSHTVDPHINPMWLHAMCGLIVTGVMQCRSVVDARTCSQPRKRPFEDTKIEKSNSVKGSEVYGQQSRGALAEIKEEVQLGLLERVLHAWKGPVHVTAILANGESSDVQRFLREFSGAPVIADLHNDGITGLFAVWQFAHGTGILHVFLLFNFSMAKAVDKPAMATLVFAAVALSNTCLLLEDEQNAWHENLHRVCRILRLAVPEKSLPPHSGKRRMEEEILSGTLLVTGDANKSNDMSMYNRDADDLVQHFFSDVVPVHSQRLASEAIKLLSFPKRFCAPVYKESHKLVTCIQLVARAIKLKKVNSLDFELFLEEEYRQFLQRLNRVARSGHTGMGTDDDDDDEMHIKAIYEALTKNITKFITSIRNNSSGSSGSGSSLAGADDGIVDGAEPVLFYVRISRKYSDVVTGKSSDRSASPAKIDSGDADADTSQPCDGEVLVIEPAEEQIQYQRRLATTAIDSTRLEYTATIEKGQQLTELTDFFQEVFKKVNEEHRARLERRKMAVSKWVDLKMGDGTVRDSTALQRQMKFYKSSLEASFQEGLCEKPCRHKCHFKCLLPKTTVDFQSHQKHECFTCKQRDGHAENACDQTCTHHQCSSPCDKPHGHAFLALSMGVTIDSANSIIKDHLCPDHLCKHPCDLHADTTCMEESGHDGRQHLCLNEHSCSEFCQQPGVCDDSTETPDGSQYERVEATANGWRKKCGLSIAVGRKEHDGAHACGTSAHKCGKPCPVCGHCCRKEVGHNDSCDTEHSVVENGFADWEKVLLRNQSGTVSVADLFRQNNSAATPGSNLGARTAVTSCFDICKLAGPKHRHYDEHDEPVAHSVFWENSNFRDQSSPEDIENFDGCLERCPCCKESYCEEYFQGHPTPTADHNVDVADDSAVFTFISQSGHRFKCSRTPCCGEPCLHKVKPDASWRSQGKAIFVAIKCNKECKRPRCHTSEAGSPCDCGQVHVCDKECASAGCNKPCEEEYGTAHKPHSCGELKCSATCVYQGDKSHLDSGSHSRSAKKKCDKPCKLSHFHHGQKCFCGEHMCRKRCTIRPEGRCPLAKQGGGAIDGDDEDVYCKTLLTSMEDEHKGNCTFTCGEEREDHLCPKECVNARKRKTSVCKTHCSKLLSQHADRTHICDGCLEQRKPVDGNQQHPPMDTSMLPRPCGQLQSTMGTMQENSESSAVEANTSIDRMEMQSGDIATQQAYDKTLTAVESIDQEQSARLDKEYDGASERAHPTPASETGSSEHDLSDREQGSAMTEGEHERYQPGRPAPAQKDTTGDEQPASDSCQPREEKDAAQNSSEQSDIQSHEQDGHSSHEPVACSEQAFYDQGEEGIGEDPTHQMPSDGSGSEADDRQHLLG